MNTRSSAAFPAITTAWHADEGISGSKAAEDRPGLAAALEAVQSQQAAVLNGQVAAQITAAPARTALEPSA